MGPPPPTPLLSVTNRSKVPVVGARLVPWRLAVTRAVTDAAPVRFRSPFAPTMPSHREGLSEHFRAVTDALHEELRRKYENALRESTNALERAMRGLQLPMVRSQLRVEMNEVLGSVAKRDNQHALFKASYDALVTEVEASNLAHVDRAKDAALHGWVEMFTSLVTTSPSFFVVLVFLCFILIVSCCVLLCFLSVVGHQRVCRSCGRVGRTVARAQPAVEACVRHPALWVPALHRF